MMTIGNLARAAGVGVETIRFYERRGLLMQPPRPASGFRTYDEHALERLCFIRRAREHGFTLAEVRQLLELRLDPRRSCSEVKAEAEAKIEAFDQKIASLRSMRAALVEVSRICPGDGPTSSCPILDAIERPTERRGSDAVQEG